MADIYFTNSDGKRVAVSAANPLPTSGASGGGAVAWEAVENKPSEFPAESHTQAARDVDSGTISTARSPALAISKITGLQAKINEIEGRLDALENPEDPEP